MVAPGTMSLRETLNAKREIVREKHNYGLSGIDTCAELCRVVDDIILELFEANREGFNGALVALGGYGRGLMNPFSDVDLLFLLPDGNRKSSDSPNAMIGGLWDLGLKVGHSARTIGDAITIGLTDITARTSMIECRFLAGNQELYDEFRKKYTRKVIRYKPYDFIKAKVSEMEQRHMAHGRVVRLTQPNLKESKGGLRDFHTALWLMRSKLDFDSLEDLVSRGLMDPDDLAPVNNAHSYILRVRNALHWRLTKPSDTLAHALQPDIARGEGYSGSDNEISAELMRHYFLSAETIDAFVQEMYLTAYDYKRLRLWPARIRKDSDGLFTDGKKLHATSFPPSMYNDGPNILFRIAKRISEEELGTAPNLRRGLMKLRQTAPDEWFEGKAAGECLLSILRLRKSARALCIFNDTGILQRFAPEFWNITRLSQFDLFHKYSVDQHTLMAIRNLEEVTEAPHVSPELKNIFRSEKNVEIVKLALLFHDLGKRAEDHHATEEDKHTKIILHRLGLESLVEEVLFLTNKHLLMSTVAQRRDFTIPRTLRSFCDEVGGRAYLRRMYLLTYADISAVGPEVWTQWKDQLLCELYEQSRQYFIEGEAYFLSTDAQMEALEKETIKKFGSAEWSSVVHGFLERAPDRYIRTAEPETVVADIRQMETLSGKRVALRFNFNQSDATGKITLIARERLGFFSVIAGAFAAKNLSIVEAQIVTFKGHMALDTLTVAGNLGYFKDSNAIGRFEIELGELLDGTKNVNDLVIRRTRYMSADQMSGTQISEPQVHFLNDLSEKKSVVEIWAPDRIGLLYDITRTFAQLRLDIYSAKISTEGPTAINVFYVTTEEGGKVEDEGRREEARTALIKAITSPIGEG